MRVHLEADPGQASAAQEAAPHLDRLEGLLQGAEEACAGAGGSPPEERSAPVLVLARGRVAPWTQARTAGHGRGAVLCEKLLQQLLVRCLRQAW